MSAIETAFAKIDADAIARKAQTSAINADTRVAYLALVAKANDVEVTQDGEAGFAELMAHFMSSRAIRRQRAKTLYLARRSYLFNRHSMWKALQLAADLRKQERERVSLSAIKEREVAA